jgi:hypothetical protein
MAISKPFSQKKVYNSPQLREYGDLRLITGAGKAAGMIDGGATPTNKS